LVNAVIASDLRQPDRAVALVIAHRTFHERPEDGCYIGVKRLSDESGFSERSVRTSLRRLEADGIVLTEQRFGRSSVFVIDAERLSERARPLPERRFRGPAKPKADEDLTPAPRAALKSPGQAGQSTPENLTPAPRAPTPAPQVLTPAPRAGTPAPRAPVTGVELVSELVEEQGRDRPEPRGPVATVIGEPEPPRTASGDLTADEQERRKAAQLAKLAALTAKAAPEIRLGKDNPDPPARPVDEFERARLRRAKREERLARQLAAIGPK